MPAPDDVTAGEDVGLLIPVPDGEVTTPVTDPGIPTGKGVWPILPGADAMDFTAVPVVVGTIPGPAGVACPTTLVECVVGLGRTAGGSADALRVVSRTESVTATCLGMNMTA